MVLCHELGEVLGVLPSNGRKDGALDVQMVARGRHLRVNDIEPAPCHGMSLGKNLLATEGDLLHKLSELSALQAQTFPCLFGHEGGRHWSSLFECLTNSS